MQFISALLSCSPIVISILIFLYEIFELMKMMMIFTRILCSRRKVLVFITGRYRNTALYSTASGTFFSIYLLDSHCLDVFARRIPTVQSYYSLFQKKILHSDSKPELVFRSGSPCIRREFSLIADCLRLVQSVLTGDHSGKPLSVCCRHGGKRWFHETRQNRER